MSPKVAGYFRVSVARDDMKAPEIYSEEIKRYCLYRQLTLAKIFSDIDKSGYNNPENRPGLKELIRRRHDFSAVIIPKLWFGRSLKHLTQLFDMFVSANRSFAERPNFYGVRKDETSIRLRVSGSAGATYATETRSGTATSPM
jgi:hypothetical protein